MEYFRICDFSLNLWNIVGKDGEVSNFFLTNILEMCAICSKHELCYGPNILRCVWKT